MTGPSGDNGSEMAFITTVGVTTITVPNWASGMIVEAQGGGGGGYYNINGYGGGQGGFIEAHVAAGPGDEFDVTVGAGGAGGTALSPDGGDGGDSSVAISGGAMRLVAQGGNGGDLIATHTTGGNPGFFTFSHANPNPATFMQGTGGGQGEDDLVQDGGTGSVAGGTPAFGSGSTYGWGAEPDGENGASGYVEITYLQ